MKKLLFPVLLIVLLCLGCAPGSCVTSFPIQPPIINSFDADPPSISAGESATLSWSVSGANKVSIEPEVGSVALAGKRMVSPATTTTYTLTAANAAGTVTATVQVIVKEVPPPPVGLPVINYFTANPGSITVGSSSTLSWNVSNATSVTIDPGIGAVEASGTRSVLPAATTTYTLTATNASGSAVATTQVIVSAAPPPAGLPVVNYFTASPPVISAGGTTTLSWSVSNATSVSIDQGIGAVGLVGTVLVSPATTTDYTLTASNAVGWYSVTITVLVTGAPTPLADLVITTGSPTVTPSTVAAGGTVSLSGWTVKNQGTAASGAFYNGFYLSTDAVITPSDIYLDGNSNSGLAPGAQFNWGGPTLTIPAGTPPGNYYIGILVDRTNAVAESNENNNYVSKLIRVVP